MHVTRIYVDHIEKLFEYVTTMVCVAVKGKPVIGVIHNPFTQATTWAWDGRSMSEDLAKIRIDESLAKTPIFIVSRSHTGNAKELTKKVFGDNAVVRPAGGAGMLNSSSAISYAI